MEEIKTIVRAVLISTQDGIPVERFLSMLFTAICLPGNALRTFKNSI